MEKKIKIGKKDVTLRATAATPLHYRNTFKGFDMIREMGNMNEDDFDGAFFERLLFIMAGGYKEANFEEWLDQFELMDIYGAIDEVVSLWSDNAEMQSIDNSKNEEAAES